MVAPVARHLDRPGEGPRRYHTRELGIQGRIEMRKEQPPHSRVPREPGSARRREVPRDAVLVREGALGDEEIRLPRELRHLFHLARVARVGDRRAGGERRTPREARVGVHRVDVREPEPVELEGLAVTVIPRRTFNELRDLDIRLSRGAGRFVLRKEIEERGGNLITLIQGMPGVRVQGGGGMMSNRTVVMRRAKHITSPAAGVMAIEACYPAIFVDGRRFSRRASLGDQPIDLTEFLASDMDAVEVYSGTSVPASFGGGDAACGAILIWTKGYIGT